jgi:hypothetical protein
MPAHPGLIAHSNEFRKEIIELAPGAYAVGTILSMTAEGRILIRTTMQPRPSSKPLTKTSAVDMSLLAGHSINLPVLGRRRCS